MNKKTEHAEEHKEEETLVNTELEETKNKRLRALADFDNYKKRVVFEREQFAQFANQALIAELLPVLDGFGRAIEAAKGNEEIVKGLALIKKQFEDALIKHGLCEVEAVNKPYDPHVHEAILQKEDEGPTGIVLEEMQKGYTLNGRLIRPAMVIVSKTKGDK